MSVGACSEVPAGMPARVGKVAGGGATTGGLWKIRSGAVVGIHRPAELNVNRGLGAICDGLLLERALLTALPSSAQLADRPDQASQPVRITLTQTAAETGAKEFHNAARIEAQNTVRGDI